MASFRFFLQRCVYIGLLSRINCEITAMRFNFLLCLLSTPASVCTLFLYAESQHDTFEGVGDCHIKVKRASGARGQIRVPYKIIDGTARAGVDFEATSDDIIFDNDEFE